MSNARHLPTDRIWVDKIWIDRADLQCLISVLADEGYQVVGPVVRQDAIVYDQIDSIDQLPKGLRDDQSAGTYRLKPTGKQTCFEFNVGPHSWKKFLFPPKHTVATADRIDDTWQFSTPQNSGPLDHVPKYAFLGVRACELAAIAIQDRVFMGGPYVDPDYRARRQQCFIVAVNCTVAASTCFCTSMNTGPRCSAGFDLALTELDDGFVIEIGTEKGQAIAVRLNTEVASETQVRLAGELQQRAVDQITKRLDTSNVHDLLLEHLDHPHWDDVAERCLSCTNCTMVCPTCFCATVSDVTDLQGQHADRVRQWDSCFNFKFSHTASGTVRGSIRSRYRQWLTHKLASWHDQFDTSGCVGCGRCITWCPVGIDLTEEVAAIREQPDEARTKIPRHEAVRQANATNDSDPHAQSNQGG